MGSHDEVVWELPGYVLLERIALGGRGEVYLAREGGIDGPLVAVKVLRPEDASRKDRVEAFLDEVRISVLLVHPNIVRVYHGDIHQGLPYLVMEHVDGLTLWDLNERARMVNQTIPFELAAYMVGKVSEALAYAHVLAGPHGRPLNLVHRDVSAVNVMSTFDGAIKLLDFGIARATIRHQQTAPGIIKGKLDYLSPEQCEGGTIDAVTDVYSMGVLLFELITGTRPFWETDVARLFRLVSRGDRPRVRDLKPGTPPYLERVVDKAMATKKKQRYQSAQLLLDDLKTFMSSLHSKPTSTSVAELMVELAPDKVSNIANSYGPAETTAVQHVSLPESSQPVHETDLEAAPTIANFNYEEALQPFTDDVDNERTQIDRSAPSGLGLEADLGDDDFDERYGQAVGSGFGSDTVVEESPVLSELSRPPPSRTILLVLALVALFSVAILAGILVTLSVRRGQANSQEHQELIQGTSDSTKQGTSGATQPRDGASIAPSATCQLLVRVVPPHAEVSVDGETRTADDGSVSFTVPPGPHDVRATTPDGQSASRMVTVTENEPMAITINVGITMGQLTVRTRRRAMVYVGPTKIGLAPVEQHELEPGDYTVKVVSRRAVRQEDITILPGQLEELEFDF